MISQEENNNIIRSIIIENNQNENKDNIQIDNI